MLGVQTQKRFGGAVRLFGVNIPGKLNMRSGLPLLYGIGKHNLYDVCAALKWEVTRRFDSLSDSEVEMLRVYIEQNYKVEGDLRGLISQNIKRLFSIGCYRGIMMRRGLPVRGQRTKTNARTRKGPKRSFGKK